MWPLDVRQHSECKQNTAIWAIKCENLLTVNVSNTVYASEFQAFT
jgi:hypothetical protein